MDRLFGEAPTRETNAAGYLIRIRENTPQSEPGGETGKRGGIYQNMSTNSGHRPSSRMVTFGIGELLVHQICSIPQDVTFFPGWQADRRVSFPTLVTATPRPTADADPAGRR